MMIDYFTLPHCAVCNRQHTEEMPCLKNVARYLLSQNVQPEVVLSEADREFLKGFAEEFPYFSPEETLEDRLIEIEMDNNYEDFLDIEEEDEE
jgi:hypothetical protein